MDVWAGAGGRVCVPGSGSDFSRESASPGGHIKRTFLIQEVWVRLENCISNKFPSDANAAGLGTRLWEQ